jgi:lipid-binding SYLF domain-containing protein
MNTKIIVVTLGLLLGFAGAALAIDRTELDNRISMLKDKLDALEHGDRAIPADTLRHAQGIMLLDRTKAGFLFAYQGGGGVALVRDQAGKWSPPAFVSANEASLGLQIGGEQRFVVVLFMTTNSTPILTEGKIDFGAEARASANNDTSGVQTSPQTGPSVLVYDDKQGLYAGAAVKGNAVTPDDDANRTYYGGEFSMRDILFDHRVQSSPAAVDLTQKIHECSQMNQAGR